MPNTMYKLPIILPNAGQYIILLCLSAQVANGVAQDSIPPLEIVEAARQMVPLERLFDGTVEAVHQATVSSQTAGRIAEVNYDVDDYVEAGSNLIRFTDVEQQTALRQARATLEESRARAVEAEEEYKRAESLKERGLGSQRDLDRAVATRDAAAARVNSARSSVTAAEQQVEYTLVRAPYPGIVTERHVEVGEAVTVGQALMSGLSLDRLRIAVNLPQGVALQVRVDPRAEIITSEGRIIPDQVTVFPVADPLTNTFQVRLDLPDGQFGLYPGMYVKVVFQTGEAERLLIPVSSLIRRSEVTAVYVVDGENIRLRQVRTGKSIGERVEVLAGLAAGEQVALDPVRAGIQVKTAAANKHQ